MLTKCDPVIVILKSRILAREGTQMHTGLMALSACDGKSYSYFRSLCGGEKGSKFRKFSPSSVWRRAVSSGFARFADIPDVKPCQTLQKNDGDAAIQFIPKQVTSKISLSQLNDVRELIVAEGVSLDLPGIYAWKVESIGTYIGKYARSYRPLFEYNKNVARLMGGGMYRPKNPTGFRCIHRALAQAITNGFSIELHILKNCSTADLNDWERRFIVTTASGGLDG